MAVFYNQATLYYNNTVTNSNVVTGEIVEVLSADKYAVSASYTQNEILTYVISVVNSGNMPYSDIKITDNLGKYNFCSTELVPLTYINNSLKLFINGILQPAPEIKSYSPLEICNLSIPANGNALLIYQAQVNRFAPLDKGAEIVNTAVICGSNISDITVSSSVKAEESAILSISKAICPSSVAENGQLTYTFVIENNGNTAAEPEDKVVVTDIFDPILKNITVTYNSQTLTKDVDYQYNPETGDFMTISGKLTVAAATYDQDKSTGLINVTPGVGILKISGNI